MKYALINGEKVEAIKGFEGTCPNCGSELIAKCGKRKMHHWAHKRIRDCDPWWENETEWHRLWKNNYSKDWQEISLFDENTSEKHIADVRTVDGLTIEFQHSSIHLDERGAREKFYKNMVWVVDGIRLKKDYPRFLKGMTNFRNTNNPQIFEVNFLDLDECFPSAWIGSSAPVIFDFKGNETFDDPKHHRNYLCCIFPKKDGRSVVHVAIFPRQYFIESTTSSKWLSMIRNYLEGPKQNQQSQQRQRIQNFRSGTESSYVFHKGRYIKRKRL